MTRGFVRASRTPVALLLAVGLVMACDPAGTTLPELPKVAALRAPASALEILTGPPCEGVTRIRLMFTAADGTLVRTVVEAPRPRTVEQLTVGVAPEGFTVTEPLPPAFDWRDFEELSIDAGPGDGWVGRATVPLAEVAAGGAEHADDAAAFVPGAGWLDAAEISARDGEDFLMLCTPEPARD
ncbi:hypothetical protein [Mumia zhuanghuii]|uniref:Uncharacterized protein n=1 Tax=Mumia zhuanghuii TaxID=2585211 RepID=A0A5C4MKS6_9ACTN|nr:hypothetical protein [Mumia zhuanghuii]TNC42291.1 hypothetical protein FHE65_21580 [Mumia zhuanghuii]TNC46335.1 hypothetical protein FHE65_12965 [Mumia zhuanghuii]